MDWPKWFLLFGSLAVGCKLNYRRVRASILYGLNSKFEQDVKFLTSKSIYLVIFSLALDRLLYELVSAHNKAFVNFDQPFSHLRVEMVILTNVDFNSP